MDLDVKKTTLPGVRWIHTILKVQFFNFSYKALLNPCMKFDFFLAKNIKMTIRKNIQNMSKGPQNSGFIQEKVQKGIF